MKAPPALRLPFRLRGFEGRVEVFCEANRDPRGLGFGLLELPFALARVKGFPVGRTEITRLGPGYHAVMGWIQLVSVRDASGRGLDRDRSDAHPPRPRDALRRARPQAATQRRDLAGRVVSRRLPRRRSEQARPGGGGLFLRLHPPSGALNLLEVARLDPERWLAHLPHLEARFPSWTFLPASHLGASAPQNWSHSA